MIPKERRKVQDESDGEKKGNVAHPPVTHVTASPIKVGGKKEEYVRWMIGRWEDGRDIYLDLR